MAPLTASCSGHDEWPSWWDPGKVMLDCTDYVHEHGWQDR